MKVRYLSNILSKNKTPMRPPHCNSYNAIRRALILILLVMASSSYHMPYFTSRQLPTTLPFNYHAIFCFPSLVLPTPLLTPPSTSLTRYVVFAGVECNPGLLWSKSPCAIIPTGNGMILLSLHVARMQNQY